MGFLRDEADLEEAVLGWEQPPPPIQYPRRHPLTDDEAQLCNKLDGTPLVDGLYPHPEPKPDPPSWAIPKLRVSPSHRRRWIRYGRPF